MHVRVRLCGKPETIVVVPSKLTKIETFRKLLEDKFGLEPNLQRLFYGGKLLDDGYSFHDYNIKLNDVIQLMQKVAPPPESSEKSNDSSTKTDDYEEGRDPTIKYEDATSKLYRVGDLVDIRERVHNAWFEGKIVQIVKDPEYKTTKPKPQSGKFNRSPQKVNGKSPSKHEDLKCTNDDKKTPDKKCKTPLKKQNGIDKSDADTSQSSSGGSSPKPNVSPKNKTPKRGIQDYFSKGIASKVTEKCLNEDEKISNGHSSTVETKTTEDKSTKKNLNKIPTQYDDQIVDEDSDEEVGLLYKAFFDEEEENSAQYCKLSEIRPRARKEIPIEEVRVNQTILLNYNIEEPNEKGFWYDFKIQEIKKLRKNTELIGTLYHGKDVPLNDVRVKVQDKIYAIETIIPLSKRSKEYEMLMITTTDKRSGPLVCTKCRDDPETSCKECGCNICAGKNQPENIILCDECNQGYHLTCLQPPLEDLPSEDWYCADCKRDPSSVVAPGGKTQVRKPNQHKTRDWGRGMACVGKTQTCGMPANHFGPIPGIEVGMAWRFRIQLSESGVHRPPVSGIHGRDVDGAYSIVLSGGYEDDVDHGFEFTYTGSGGRDLSGNKRTADQSSDQTLTRENKALARNCAVKEVKEEGADSGGRWREGKPVRVVRSYKMLKHFPEYAPKEGIRYDGIYKVVKYYPEKGKSGFRVWKYLLRRDDPTPAPWEEKGKMFPIVYPDGYLEAEAEKQAQKEKERLKNQKSPSSKKTRKRPLRESNGAEDSDDEVDKKKRKSRNVKDNSPPPKKMKTRSSIGTESKEEEPPIKTSTPKRKKLEKSAKKTISPSTVNPFTLAVGKKTKMSNDENMEMEVLSKESRDAIMKDNANKKLWEECLLALETDGKKGLVDKVSELFLCIICQEVAANPVTTSCSHNFCLACLKLAFKSTETNCCPYCRNDLSKEEITENETLKIVLRAILPGYDIRKK